MKYKQLFEADGPFPNFPDNVEGARSLLKRDSIHSHKQLDKAEINPGPGGAGHWVVKMPNGKRASVYVGSHPLAPDFEDLDH